MTRIIEISGLPASSERRDAKSEMAQRAKLVSPRTLVDTVNWSVGEALVNIRAQRAKMIMEYYQGLPVARAAKKEYELAKDLLAKGLHRNFAGFTGLFDQDVSGVLSAIRSGYSQTQPASGFFTWEEKRSQGQRTPNNAIANPLVPVRDCNAEYPMISPFNIIQGNITGAQLARIRAVFPNLSPADIMSGALNLQQAQTIVQTFMNKRNACLEENKYRKVFNDHLEKTAHHPLYLHLSAAQANNETFTVADKRREHALFLEWMGKDSKIPANLLKEWMINGVMRSNVAQNGEPWTPEQTIAIMKENAEKHRVGIGDFGITAAILIVGALAAAITNAKILAGIIKGEKTIFQGFKDAFKNSIDFIGSADWGADAPDWVKAIPPSGPGGGGNQNEFPPLDPGAGGNAPLLTLENGLLLGGLGLLVVMKNKK